ncbi:MAG: hypothetical protein GYB67_15115 [Chloroflexi bacterium]|nr:hypothetical protein [Chloroflexota bacterium]
MMITEAIDHYHSLLTDQLAADIDGVMRSTLFGRGLYFGTRPVCTVLRPHFYFAEHWQYLKIETEKLLGAFARAHAACMEDAELRSQLALESFEEELFGLDFGGPVPWTTSRLDSFYQVENQSLRYVEYNAETPAGMGYEDVLAELFFELESLKRFQEHYHVEKMPMLKTLLDVLLRAYRESAGSQTHPQIAIVDWHDVPTLNEHELSRISFERHGVRTILADPRSLEYRNGHLWAGGFRIDIVYKRVLISELIRRMGMNNPIVRAVRDKAVLMTNSFSAKLMAKKASFAFLSDEQNHHLFTEEQLHVIANHIPWTRIVADRSTVYKGEKIDLLQFVSQNRDRFVLKPNDEYGGKGVILGWETPIDAWNEALRQALTSPHVVQERVSGIVRNFPTWVNDKLDISPRFVDADPYIFYGDTVYGCLTRLSSVSLLNVTAGGGSVVPTFLITKKD